MRSCQTKWHSYQEGTPDLRANEHQNLLSRIVMRFQPEPCCFDYSGSGSQLLYFQLAWWLHCVNWWFETRVLTSYLICVMEYESHVIAHIFHSPWLIWIDQALSLCVSHNITDLDNCSSDDRVDPRVHNGKGRIFNFSPPLASDWNNNSGFHFSYLFIFLWSCFNVWDTWSLVRVHTG